MTFISPIALRQSLSLSSLSADGFALNPSPVASAAIPEYFGAVWSRNDLAEPKKPVLVGQIDLADILNSPWHFDINSFLVKPSNSALMFIPAELAPFVPFIQRCIDNEFSAGSEAFLKRKAVLIVDSSTPEIGKAFRPHAEGLHGHPPYKALRGRAFNPQNPGNIKNTHYYALSTRNATRFFTGAISLSDIDDTGFGIKPNNYACDFQAKPGDITLFTSVHAHVSPNEVCKNDVPRTFVNLIFEDANSDAEPERPNPMLDLIRSRRMTGNTDEAAKLVAEWRANTRLQYAL